MALFNRRVAAVLVAVLGAAALTYAQQIWVGGGRRGGREAPRWPAAADFDGGFMYCRSYFNGGWSTDYPGADNNFSVRLAELTKVPVKFDPNRQPHHIVVPLTDPLMHRCPMIFMTNHGSAFFSGEEVTQLRDFFNKGGFLWADDSWGSRSWQNWVYQISRVLPPGEFPMFDIPADHAIMRSLYDVREIPQVPAINFWRGSGGETSEQGWDSATVIFKGIQDQHGRLMVLMTHNTDISDTWEREGEEPREYFDLFSPRGYAIGVNVVLYAMTH
jgi:hypothetical protein